MKPGSLTILRNFPPDDQLHRLRELQQWLSPSEKKRLETGLIQLVHLIPREWSPAEKAAALYRALTEILQYDHLTASAVGEDSREDQSYTYLGALFNGTAVCNGISQLYVILCRCCGIHCQVVEGFAGPEEDMGLHAWVQLRLPDSKGTLHSYHCDPTWDLLEFRGNHPFRYFLKSDDYFEYHRHHWFRYIGQNFGWHKFDECPHNCLNIPTIPEDRIRQIKDHLKTFRTPQPYILKKF